MNTHKQILLVIFDGWGLRSENEYNAIAKANPKFFNSLWQTYPHASLEASGLAIGLPEGQIGTSEIGHFTIGAGRVIDTDIVRVNKAITNNQLKDNDTFNSLFDHIKTNNSTLHIMGLIGPGGIHSHQDHLVAFLKLAKEKGIKKIALHAFTDGRDLPPKSADTYIKQTEELLTNLGIGRIATISGRYYAMDRDKNWDRVQKSVDAIFEGKGHVYENKTASEVIEDHYTKNITDEFIEPSVLVDKKRKPTIIEKNDGVFFFNFRPDRAREISKKISERVNDLNLYFVTLTQYEPGLTENIAFPPLQAQTSLSQEIANAGLTQVHIAETEKYAHVTYFLNGGVEEKHTNEMFEMISSRKDVPTHDKAPEMKAEEIADKTIEYIHKDTNLIALNFANPDMVGHTGNFDATVAAIKIVDKQLQRVVEAVLENNGIAIITADHGNAELMFNTTTNQPQTAHTLNPVPLIVTDKDINILPTGGLADIAPTVLALMGINQPKEMTGKNLITK